MLGTLDFTFIVIGVDDVDIMLLSTTVMSCKFPEF